MTTPDPIHIADDMWEAQQAKIDKLAAELATVRERERELREALKGVIAVADSQRRCQKCGDKLTGHEDENGTHCRFCVTHISDISPSSLRTVTTKGTGCPMCRTRTCLDCGVTLSETNPFTWCHSCWEKKQPPPSPPTLTTETGAGGCDMKRGPCSCGAWHGEGVEARESSTPTPERGAS